MAIKRCRFFFFNWYILSDTIHSLIFLKITMLLQFFQGSVPSLVARDLHAEMKTNDAAVVQTQSKDMEQSRSFFLEQPSSYCLGPHLGYLFSPKPHETTTDSSLLLKGALPCLLFPIIYQGIFPESLPYWVPDFPLSICSSPQLTTLVAPLILSGSSGHIFPTLSNAPL